ncbi:MAG: adenylyltransferase/cytidyltransferase family protein [Chloroflexi bacterium]|nr:adenylyltransferase/cytidyltransferase family protein [Chloroflexota bacterium]MBK6708748.1 adenylyltransferase/cytidyltransferase family protein [Chloroflexota bacterium]MBK7179303.1 adenylyltransferase/cytidyltransferase family protein [Chloroflexota bacterium]MBK8934328.1 adenylyltransferase/cytidyltransferase family protein [Chloroflexota bacterium]MBP7591436.1 adenylyltransferase/cytidyltransferase family protein [Chloroflexota bacterium]
MAKKVFVSGCYDLLHSGHIAFFNEAATYGDLYVALGSDKTVYDLKGRTPVNTEDERLYMVKSVKCVKEAFISQGSGMLDFLAEFTAVQPDLFIVNEDGNTPDKQQLCEEFGVEYVILHREPHTGLAARSTTALRTLNQMPFRIDLAGGWLDQPFVSRHYPGAVITISIEPTLQFNDRSGMASSTRRAAIDMWGPRLPVGNPEKLAKILFCYDNPPGTKEISGSQDAIGLVFPGLAKANYAGDYWPASIERLQDELSLQFVENALYLVTLGPRHAEYDVLADTRITPERAKALADPTEACWQAIQEKDIAAFGRSIRESFEAQIAMFPNMMNDSVARLIEKYHDMALGWKLSGAGGGGYMILVSDRPIENAVRVIARREHE